MENETGVVTKDSGSTNASAVISSASKITISGSAGSLASACECGGGTRTPPSYVYSIGNIKPISPSLSLQKALDWKVGATGTNLPDYALLYAVLSQGENVGLTRQMCWVMQTGTHAPTGPADTYLIVPRSYQELFNMVDGIKPDQETANRRYDVVIGPRGPIAPPQMCNGLQLPLVVCNQIYTFTFSEFVSAVALKTQVSPDDVGSMFFELLQLADNAGETDEHRALNYIALRYPDIYILAASMLRRGPGSSFAVNGIYTLQEIIARPAPVQGARRIVEIIFRYMERQRQDVVSWYCEVDTTGQFPFLVRPLSRYYPRP
jgi:hypothetical protein